MNRKDVAKQAGVSEATVSRVMNNVGPIKEETKRRVLQAASELGYEINALASQLARQKSGNIGVVLPHVPKVHIFSTYYFSEILSGIAEVAQQHNMELLMIFRHPQHKLDYSKWFRSKKIDACIILGAQDTEEERESLRQLQEQKHPFCLINQCYENEKFLSVDGDHYNGSFEAVKHLLKKQVGPTAMINGPLTYSNSKDRLAGYCAALKEYGITYQERWMLEGNYSRKSGYQLAAKMAELIKTESCKNIFAANDRMAFGLMEGLLEHGLEAGKHYRIVGYDDSDGARIVTPKLTSVAVPFYEMGRKAANLLLDESTLDEHRFVLPVQLVVRQTS